MKIRVFTAFVIALALSVTMFAQDAPPLDQGPAQGAGVGSRGGQGERGGWGGGGGMMGGGRGFLGTVTAVAADHYSIKTDAGESYTVFFSVNTRILKQGVGQRRSGEGGNPPQSLKSTDIKVGDAITALGEVDATAKSLGAMLILQVDPERAKQMREMQANYGKTWLMGKVTAIHEVKVTLMGGIDNTTHTFVADENTTFRKHRVPITLGDVQVGDMVRVEGAVNGGVLWRRRLW